MFGRKNKEIANLKKINEELLDKNLKLEATNAALNRDIRSLINEQEDLVAKLNAANSELAAYKAKEEARKEQTRKAAAARWSNKDTNTNANTTNNKGKENSGKKD